MLSYCDLLQISNEILFQKLKSCFKGIEFAWVKLHLGTTVISGKRQGKKKKITLRSASHCNYICFWETEYYNELQLKKIYCLDFRLWWLVLSIQTTSLFKNVMSKVQWGSLVAKIQKPLCWYVTKLNDVIKHQIIGIRSVSGISQGFFSVLGQGRIRVC